MSIMAEVTRRHKTLTKDRTMTISEFRSHLLNAISECRSTGLIPLPISREGLDDDAIYESLTGLFANVQHHGVGSLTITGSDWQVDVE